MVPSQKLSEKNFKKIVGPPKGEPLIFLFLFKGTLFFKFCKIPFSVYDYKISLVGSM
jgi:hypothetical protein